MDKLNFKTRILNKFRKLAMMPFIEQRLVRLTQNKTPDNFYVKIVPNNYQYPKNTIRNCERGGIRYSLDISDYNQYCIYYGIDSEPRGNLYNLVKNDTTVLDVGTNMGETLLNLALINKDGLNIGFEPVPFLFEKARHNISLNDSENIRLENLALSNEKSSLFFNFDNENHSGGIFLTTEAESKKNSQTVQAVKLDDYVEQNNLDNISLIKMDVEGFEMNVLKGAAQTIERYKPVLFVEVDNTFLQRQNSSAKMLVEFLLSKGYQISYNLSKTAVSLNDDFENKHFDIVCIPSER